MPIYKRYFFLVLFLLNATAALAQLPVASFTATPTSGCVPLTVQFDASASVGATSYLWINQLGNGTNVATSNFTPSTTYVTPGTYTVQLRVANSNGQSSIVTKTITVNDTPHVDFSATPTSGCPPLTVNFSPTGTVLGAPGNGSYQWVVTGGNPGVSNLQYPAIQYTTPGTYNVILTVTNSNSCFRSKTKTAYITVNPKPSSNFAAPQTIFCDAPANASFTSTVTGGTAPYTYNWSFGATTANASYSFPGPAPITHTVQLVVTDANNCKDTVTKPAYIDIKKHVANFTANPAAVCIGLPVTFTNTSTTNITSSFWYDGAFPIGAGSPLVYSFYTPGVHNITLVSYDGPCADTITKQITIHPKPTLNFTVSPQYPCPPPNSNVTFTPSGTCTSYQWNFGDAGGLPLIQSTATSPTHNYAPCNYYCPIVIGTDANGCKDTLQKTDEVKVLCDLLTISATSQGTGCIPLNVTFSSVLKGYTIDPNICKSGPLPVFINYPYPITSYEWKVWDKPTPTVYTTSNPSHVFDTCGVHLVTLKAITSNGCTFYDTFQVYAGSKPVANFTAVPNTSHICPNDTISFTNTTTYPCFGQGNFGNEWSFGNGKFSTDKNPRFAYDDTAGTFCVRLITAYNGCIDTIVKCPFITVDSPVAKFTINYNCDTPLKVKFNNKGFGYTSLFWDFGYGSPAVTSTQVSPVHTFPAYGVYTVKLITHNSTSGCRDTFRMTIDLINPKVYLTATDTTVCMADKVQFTSAFSDPNHSVISYQWFVDNTLMTTDSALHYTHTFNVLGYHPVKVILQDKWLCYHTLEKPNWVLVSKPNVNFTANNLSGCVPLTVSFTDQSTPSPNPGASLTTRFWDFGNAVQLTSNNPPPQVYWNAGAYDVKLVVTDNSGCKDSLTKAAYINAYKPDASFVADDSNACIAQTVNFTNTTADAASATWNFGDGSPIVNAVSTSHVYNATGSYTVTMIVTDSHGCKDTLVKANYINITKPHADFSMSDSLAICPPLISNFTNNSSAGTYTWDFGNGGSPVINPPPPISAVFPSPNYYTVTLVVTDAAGCSDTATRHVNVLGYSGAFSYTPLFGCTPLGVTFKTTLTNIPSIIWDFNDGNTLASNNQSVTHIYTTPGAYLPKLILSNGGGCTNSSIGKDTIKVDGVEAAYTNSPACEGGIVKFKDSSQSKYTSLTNWTWIFHDGQVASGSTPTHFYPSAGKYKVILIAINSNGCRDTLESELVVNKLPEISAGADTIICLHDAAQLTGTGGVSYVWSPATTLSCANCPNPLASPLKKEEYVVVGTDANKCSDTDKVVVGIKTHVTSEVGKGGEICDDETINLKAWGAKTYVWTPADNLDNANIAEPVAKPHANTIFRVVAFEGSCIPDTNFVPVTVYPKPIVKASGGATIIAGNETPINAEGKDIHKFLWAPSETLNCSDCPNPIAKPIKTTLYTIIGTTVHGCSDSDKVTIQVLCDQSQLFIPNTFTPNNDGQNDIFLPRGRGFESLRLFRVYNRWGEVVFERSNMPLNDKAAGWDGTYKGQQLSPDVFVYTIEADCDNGEVIKWKGDVTLVR